LTKRSLDPVQLRLVETIETLGFGRIEGVAIRHGKPSFGRGIRVVQEIKLGSGSEVAVGPSNPDLTLKREFDCLFRQFDQLCDGLVDIEVRRSAPFRLIVNRLYREMLP
jgi:hypothetical protein